MCLTTAKFTDRVNVEITLKNQKNLLSNKGHSALWYFGDSPGRHELIGTNELQCVSALRADAWMTKPRKPSKTGSRTLCQKQSKLASNDLHIAALKVFPGSEAAHLKLGYPCFLWSTVQAQSESNTRVQV